MVDNTGSNIYIQIFIHDNLSMLDKKKEEGEEEKKIYLKGYYHGFEEWPCYFYVKKPPLLKRDLTKKANAPMNNGTRTLSPVSSFLASMLSTHCLSLGVALLNCLVIDAKIYMHIYIYARCYTGISFHAFLDNRFLSKFRWMKNSLFIYRVEGKILSSRSYIYDI